MHLTTTALIPAFVSLFLCSVGVDLAAAFWNQPAFCAPTWQSQRTIQSKNGVAVHRQSTVQLWAKKKASSPGSSKKLQVKLLKHIAGTGQAGEVVMVTPAFFQNKLQSQKAAVLISDEQVAKEQADRDAQLSKANSIATALQEDLQQTTLTIRRKAGPDGQLFGGIGPKTILQELMELQATSNEKQDFLGQKHIKVMDVTTADGKKVRSDIKVLGEYGAKIKLSKDVTGKVAIHVVEE